MRSSSVYTCAADGQDLLHNALFGQGHVGVGVYRAGRAVGADCRVRADWARPGGGSERPERWKWTAESQIGQGWTERLRFAPSCREAWPSAQGPVKVVLTLQTACLGRSCDSRMVAGAVAGAGAVEKRLALGRD